MYPCFNHILKYTLNTVTLNTIYCEITLKTVVNTHAKGGQLFNAP